MAVEAGVSTKHLSFVETGRARPSPELLLTLARHLDVPLRDRNSLLLAAGYAPRYHETSMDAPVSKPVRASVERLLATHDPYPGVVLDRQWNIVLANDAAQRLVAGLPVTLMAPDVNVFRISLHPEGLAAITINFDEWCAAMLAQLRRLVTVTADAALTELEQEIRAYPNVHAHLQNAASRQPAEDPPLLVPCRLNVGGVELSLFTMLTTFGTARDITTDEITVELFYPADDSTEAALRSPQASSRVGAAKSS